MECAVRRGLGYWKSFIAFNRVWEIPISKGTPTKIHAAAIFQVGVGLYRSAMKSPPLCFRCGHDLDAAALIGLGFEMIPLVDSLD